MSVCASSENVARWALLHDASESLLGDMPSPIKHGRVGDPYRRLEARVLASIAERFDLSWPEPKEVKVLDMRARRREVEEYLPAALSTVSRYKPLPISFLPAWSPAQARKAYLAEARRLGLS